MKRSEVIQQIIVAVEEFAKTGQSAIPVQNMRLYLDGMIETVAAQEASPLPITEAQAAHGLEVWKTKLTASSAMSVEMLKATIEAGQTALKSAIIINGGAAIAMLAFIGNALAKWNDAAGSSLLTNVGVALFMFMVGTGAAGTSTGFRYLAQFVYAAPPSANARPWLTAWGSAANCISIMLGIASFASFFAGGWLAFHAIVNR